jgi:energy-coupling factor transport system permease protein
MSTVTAGSSAVVVDRPDTLLARRNPLAKLVAALVVMATLLVTTDIVTPSLVLAAEFAFLPLSGIGARELWRRGWPLLVAVVSITISNALFTDRDSGRELFDLGIVDLTTGGLVVGFTTALRLVAIALPGVLFALTTDPVDLADALVQQWRAPARFAYGALAAMRLAPLMGAEWETIGRARRARGLDAGRNPVAAIRLFAGRCFALLVGAVRRGTRLAMAMDARGFDAGGPRTAARVQQFHRGDVVLVLATVVVVLVATSVSVLTGSWDFLLS